VEDAEVPSRFLYIDEVWRMLRLSVDFCTLMNCGYIAEMQRPLRLSIGYIDGIQRLLTFSGLHL
jgi:hypothetical protein